MKRLMIAVLISGGGTTLKNLLDYRDRDELLVDFAVVISGRKSAAGLEYARSAGIPVEVVAKKGFDDPAEHSRAVFDHCRRHDVEYVVMGGYLDHLLIPPDFENRVINIHPSLIPAFSGKGFYGKHVHQSAIDYGVKLSGCTVHFVDNEFDHGPIIAQKSCPVLADDTADSLQKRVFELECAIYPDVLNRLAKGQIHLSGRHTALDD